MILYFNFIKVNDAAKIVNAPNAQIIIVKAINSPIKRNGSKLEKANTKKPNPVAVALNNIGRPTVRMVLTMAVLDSFVFLSI